MPYRFMCNAGQFAFIPLVALLAMSATALVRFDPGVGQDPRADAGRLIEGALCSRYRRPGPCAGFQRGNPHHGPDGRYEHRPLRLVQLNPHDLIVLAAAAAALGRELATRPHGELVEAMAAGAEAAVDPYGSPPQPVELVGAFARVHGLLDLAPTDDSTRLATLVAAAGDTDLVLDDADETAYSRTVDRFNAMWALRNGLDRFLY